MIGLIGFGGYYELKHADMIIKNKATSFSGIRKASLYIKENSNPDDLILTVPSSQVAYYAERKIEIPRKWLGTPHVYNIPFDQFIEKIKQNQSAKFFIITFSEPNHADWMRQIEYAQLNGNVVMAKWHIPFMDSTIDFTTGQQDIKKEKTFNGITFRLEGIFDDAFVYRILRE